MRLPHMCLQTVRYGRSDRSGRRASDAAQLPIGSSAYAGSAQSVRFPMHVCSNFCNNIAKFGAFSHVPTLGCAAAPPGPGPGRPGHRATAEDAPQRLRAVLSLFLLLHVACCCYCCCRSHVTNQNLLLRVHFRRMLELALLARACPLASALPQVACRMQPLASPPPRLRPRAPPAALERGPFCACSRRPHMRRAQLA